MSTKKSTAIDDDLWGLSSVLEGLTSEKPNPASEHLDTLSPLEIAQLMNQQDQLVPLAIEQVLLPVSQAIEAASKSIRNGGKVIYVGAGTSGRLGVLDASEIPPTFSASEDWFVALIAGGNGAMFRALEGAEDDTVQGATDIAALPLRDVDTVIGLAASGRTPYVLGALRKARSSGATTIGITCNGDSPLEHIVDISITPQVGPEVLTGSTRLKSGTAQKMILNMISTGAMVRVGKCYGNRMVDLNASNEKLRARAINLVQELAQTSANNALAALEAAGWDVKVAILTCATGDSVKTARQLITDNGGRLRAALAAAKRT